MCILKILFFSIVLSLKNKILSTLVLSLMNSLSWRYFTVGVFITRIYRGLTKLKIQVKLYSDRNNNVADIVSKEVQCYQTRSNTTKLTKSLSAYNFIFVWRNLNYKNTKTHTQCLLK